MDPVHIELWCPNGPEIVWQVVALRGREALSRPYEFEIELWCEDAGVDIEAALGVDAELLFERGGLTRAVYGVITDVEIEVPPPGAPEHEGVGARVTLAPAYTLLEQQVDTHFHAGQSAIEILRERLGAALAAFGRKLDVESRISGTYNSRDYCVQFRESTFDFCNRLMEEEGIAYMFVPDPDDQREVMVLVDGNAAYAAAELLVPEPIAIATHAPEELQRESIQRLDWRSRRTPNRVITRGHNYKQPARYDEGEAEQIDHQDVAREQYVDGDRRQIIDDPIGDPDAKTFTGAELQQRTSQARVLLEQQRRDAALGRGRSNAIGFAAGATFELADPPRRIDGASELLLIEVTHTAKRADGNDGAHVYDNKFTCMPRSRPYRPPLRTLRPRVHGVQTGVVVGRGDGEIHTDALGRVRVRFHADRRAEVDHRTCWIRVAQAWAGNGYGSMVIPRVGMEVVVSFVDGNPDCPLITGCVYDGVNTPPRPLPAEMSRSTFKTSSTPGGEGYNELMVEDAEGREQIFVHAQGRMDMRVRGSSFETAGGNREVVVGPPARDRGQGDFNLSIGNDVNLALGGRRYSRVEAESFQHASRWFETCDDRYTYVKTTAGFNAEQLVVETAQLASTKSNEIVHAASSTMTLKAGEQIILESNNLIGLKVGASFISIGIDGIDIGAPRVRLNSGGHVQQAAKDGVVFESFDMADPIDALVADDGRPGGGGGGGGGGGRSRRIRTVSPHHAPPMVGPKKDPPGRPPPHRGARDRQIVHVGWSQDETWCSEEVFVEGEFDKSGTQWEGTVAIIDANDGNLIREDHQDLGTAKPFRLNKSIYEVLPRETGDGKEASRSFLAVVDGVRSMQMLALRFLKSAPPLHFTENGAKFHVWVENHTVKIGGVIDYTRGWLHYLILLGDSVPEDTGGVIDDTIGGVEGWRHCKKEDGSGGKHDLLYHDGNTWLPVPMTWVELYGTRFCSNGMWKENGEVKMQYGEKVQWPDPLQLTKGAAELKSRLAQIRSDIEDYWSSKTFDIKRESCYSNLAACCGYQLLCEISFNEVSHKSEHGIIIADTDGRANEDAWPLDVDARVAAHEFGHHLGNPDEYVGAAVDRTVNDDGANAGIDEPSIMGSGNISRRRHLANVCKALSQLVEREFGKHFTYTLMEKGQL